MERTSETQAAPGLEATDTQSPLTVDGPRRRLSLLSIGSLFLVAVLMLTAVLVQAAGAQVAASVSTDGAGVASIDTGTTAEAAEEQRFVDLINELRRNKGLGELAISTELLTGATTWTEQLRTNGALSHAADLSAGVDSYWLKLGENVGVAPSDQIDALFDAFVASPAHYANLIDPDFDHIGVVVLHDDQGRMWTTHRFMDLGE